MSNCIKCGQPFEAMQIIIGNESGSWHEHCPTPSPAAGSKELLLRACVELFEAGKELSRQYERYEGDMDWVEWLRHTLPKTAINDEKGVYNIFDSLLAAQNNATYEAVMGVIGEDETHWTDHFGHESNVPTDSMKDRNQLRAELRQSIAKIFGKEGDL